MDQETGKAELIDLAAEIVSAYVSNNHVQRAELASLISTVHKALTTAASGTSGEPANPDQRKATAQEIKRSIRPDFLISFEDGKHYKLLRRHLSLRGLTPQAYREKWGLPADYPTSAPNYSKQRSELARALGLGQQRRGLAKVSGPDALKVEAFEEVAESPAGGAARDVVDLAETTPAPADEAPARKPKRAAAPRTKKRTSEPGTA